MDLRISTVLAEIDWTCDYIPIVSTVTNLVDIFNKCVYKCLPEDIAKNRYWTHIDNKELLRCLILLVPMLGNIYIAYCDYYKYQEDTLERSRQILTHENSLLSSARELARLAKDQTGIEVTVAQMMPSMDENQRNLWLACARDKARSNQVPYAKGLLDQGLDPNYYNSGTTPLVTACQYATLDMVKLLVDKGADVNTIDRLGNSPLGVACIYGDLETIKFIGDRVSNVDMANAKGVTPLMLASATGRSDVVEYLISKNADSQRQTVDGRDALSYAIYPSDYADLIPLLVKRGEDIDNRRYKHKISDTNQLVAVGAFSVESLTPLLYASLVGAKNSAVQLVALSNVRNIDSAKNNALYYASKNIKLMRALLAKCNEELIVDQRNLKGCTALHHALELDSAGAALTLLKEGHANFLLPDNNGKTPFSIACEKRMGVVLEYIVSKHAKHLTDEMKEQIANALKDQTPRYHTEKGLESAIGLMADGITKLMSDIRRKTEHASQVEEWGLEPRNSMELFLGELPLTV